jgi:SAM-dependent methyltransferase
VPDGTIEIFQAEDVFEHIPYEGLANIIDEIYRVLKPGGVFRLSVPDYRCDVYLTRVMRNDHGDIVFDPGGGGQFETGRVVGGGHLWFPVYESVKSLFDRTSFARNGEVRYLHYTDSSGAFVLRPIDHSLGPVRRTPDHDVRARDPRRPLSIVVDAIKNG